MTTIVTDSKQIAFDSMGVRGKTIVNTPSMKMREKDEHYFFLSGACTFMDLFIECFFSKEEAKEWDNVSAFILKPDKTIWVASFDGEGFVFEDYIMEGEIYAIGSGEEFAISALDLGKTPKEAVEYAMTRDIYTGGDVNVFDIETMELLK